MAWSHGVSVSVWKGSFYLRAPFFAQILDSCTESFASLESEAASSTPSFTPKKRMNLEWRDVPEIGRRGMGLGEAKGKRWYLRPQATTWSVTGL